MRMVVGVIGHVDHGKTALVRALTGMGTDRLAVEQRRGISIALGFAHLMAQGVAVDLIDMPGHERFVRTMVSGATGLARDAGLMVCGTVLTSASTGQGIDALRAALAAAVAPRPTGTEDGFPYLPIDRVFSVPGHGTVATGTLRRGPLAVSDDVALAPGGRAVRLRGLQVHGSRTSVAQPGQRVPANLRDVEPGQIARGAALTARGLLPASGWITVALRAVDSAPALPTSSRLMLLFGTKEVEGAAAPAGLRRAAAGPGCVGAVALRRAAVAAGAGAVRPAPCLAAADGRRRPGDRPRGVAAAASCARRAQAPRRGCGRRAG